MTCRPAHALALALLLLVCRPLLGQDSTPDGLKDLLSHYVRAGDYRGAEQVARRLLAVAPSDHRALAMAASVSFELGEYDTALERFRAALRLAPSDATYRSGVVASLVNVGVQRYRDGGKDEARAAFEEALDVDPGSAEALRDLAVLEMESRRYAEAILLLSRAQASDPRNPAVLQLRADCLEQTGDVQALEETLVTLSELQPSNPSVWARLGMLRERAGAEDGAEKAFRMAERCGTDEPYPYFWLARRDSDVYLAQLAVGRAVRKLGLLTLEAKQAMDERDSTLDEAGIERLRTISRAMEEPRAVLADSLALVRAIRADDVAYGRDLELFVQWYPHTADVRSSLSAFLTEKGRFDDARRQWEAVIRDAPARADAHIGLASCEEAAGNIAGAIVSLRKALALEPENPAIYDHLARFHRLRGNMADLVALLEERLLIDSWNPVLLQALIPLETEAGLLDAARAHRDRLDKIQAARTE